VTSEPGICGDSQLAELDAAGLGTNFLLKGTPLRMRLLCFLTGHHPGRPFHLLGVEVRSCVLCGAVTSRG
jgi:hypothetical protein